MSKVLFVIAQNGFRDEEFLVPKKILSSGNKIVVASKSKGLCVGKLGAKVEADISLAEAIEHVETFDAVIFIGGPGAREYVGNIDALNLARAANDGKRILAAICIAPTIFAKAGVLLGKKATVWNDDTGSYSKEITELGAHFENKSVVVDDLLVTANGPDAAEDFGKVIKTMI